MRACERYLRICGILGVVVVLGGCGKSGGPGNFDRPAKVTKMSANLVRYYDECTSPNASSSTTTPGCTPPPAASPYTFGPKGRCSIKATAVQEKVCEEDPLVTCNDVKLVVNCSDIRQAGGNPVTAAADSGWFLKVVYRATIADMNGDMTLYDVPMTVDLTTVEGKVLFKGKPMFDFLTTIQSMLAAEYVGPLNAQIVDVWIQDPGGNRFAVLGLSSGS